jgi:hypothetical protein
MENQTDKKVQEFFKVVQQKKTEIAKAEKPDWKTNCSFSYNKDSGSRINLQVVADVEELVMMLAFLIDKNQSFDKAQSFLGTDLEFKWMGFTFNEWKSDIQTRINKVQISKKKKELEALESRLDKLISPELKAQMELDEISKLLS